jgi:PAS domain S-box-containing protein
MLARDEVFPLNRSENINNDQTSLPPAMVAAQQSPPRALVPFARTVAAVCILLGVFMLGVWWLSEPSVSSVFPGLVMMKPNTALCFMLGGLSLAGLLAHSRASDGGLLNRLLVTILPVTAAALLLVACLTLLSYVMQAPVGIDKLLVPDELPSRNSAAFPWRMSPVSAIGFAVLAIAMLPWPARSTHLWLAMELIVLVTAVAAFIMVLGYAYRAPSLYSVPGYAGVALHTALGLLVLTNSVLIVHPRFLLTRQIMASDQAGAEMRRLLPAAILIPCIVGWSLLQGQRQGWYGAEFGLAMFTAANMLVFSTLVWWNSRAVRRGEQRRRDLEGRLADILNSATDAIITVDEDLRICLFNRAAEHIFGRRSNDVIGQPLDVLLPEPQRQRHIQHIQNYARTPAEQRETGVLGDIHGVRANGDEFPIEASISQVESGGSKLMTVILRDVTERNRTETALHAHLRRVEALAEMDRAILGMRSTREIAETALHHLRRMVPCSCANVVVFDKHSGAQRLLATNAGSDTDYIPHAHPVFAYEQAQMGSIEPGQAIVIGDLRTREPRVDLFRQLLNAGAVSYAGLPLRGEQRLLGMLELIDQEPDRFDAEQLQAARTIADQLAIALQQALLREDIDRHTASLERRVRERTQELEETNQELTAANRDLEEFTASAAHDLRAPLHAMAGNCVLLRRAIKQSPAEVRHRMEHIDTSVRRMNDVIDGMLALARLTKIELTRQSVDLNVVAGEVISELQQQYPAHRVQYKVACGKAICADPRLMRSLLVNLLGNAWKYTTLTEVPSVELARLDDEPVPTFMIRDNGVGFDMNFAQHLFEPFRRMHTLAEFPGVGIGLATAARIVHRYGGKIWAESAVGAGAAFYFTLPRAVACGGDDIAEAG